MNISSLLGLTITLVILGSTASAFATVDVIDDYKKITSITVGTDDGSTIGFGAGDLFGYKSTNIGDIDNNGTPDFVTIAFEAEGIGHNEFTPTPTQEQLGTAYLVLLNANGSVKESRELSNCAADNNELRESRTFGENLDYLGVINGKPTLLISDYWFSTIHVLSIDTSDYSHTCSSFTVSGLDDLGWPFTVAGNVATDGNLNSVPDLIVGASVWDGIDPEFRYRDEMGINLYKLDLTVDPTTFDITATKQIIDNSLLDVIDPDWDLRLFENVIVADIDGLSSTTDIVLGEPRVADVLFTDGNTTGNTIHVIKVDASNVIQSVTTTEFTGLDIALNQVNKQPNFGIGLANLGDLNNDGVDDIAVGLEFLDIGQDNSGGVAIMFLNADGSIKAVYLIANGSVPYALDDSDYFGKGLEAIDLDGDGFSELIASAHEDNTGGTDAGAVYVLTLDEAELGSVNYDMTPTPVILNPTFDNYFTEFTSLVNYAYADDPTPAFGVIQLPFTSTTTVVSDVLTVQTIDFAATFCQDLTIDELISSGNYTVFDNRDGSLGSKVKGTSGNDLMIASNDGDTLIGNNGDDCMIGGSGDDILKGKKGNDEMYGNDGNDLIRGNQGDDVIYGNSGNDELHGGKDSDILNGGLGDDILRGKKGSDTLNGGLGNDNLFGGKDNDFLYGNEGDDNLNGRKGIDTCDGGIGINTIKNCEL